MVEIDTGHIHRITKEREPIGSGGGGSSWGGHRCVVRAGVDVDTRAVDRDSKPERRINEAGLSE